MIAQPAKRTRFMSALCFMFTVVLRRLCLLTFWKLSDTSIFVVDLRVAVGFGLVLLVKHDDAKHICSCSS